MFRCYQFRKGFSNKKITVKRHQEMVKLQKAKRSVSLPCAKPAFIASCPYILNPPSALLKGEIKNSPLYLGENVGSFI